MGTRYLIIIIFFHFSLFKSAWAQQAFKVLLYTETSGFDHQTRQNSFLMFQSLGADNNFSVDHDTDGSAFNSLTTLQQYAVVIFANTSGDNILDSVQRMNFEGYLNGGGSFLGIHAASDTYRHSTANGTNTGTWDWYAEMLGASVQQNPNHVSGTPLYRMSKTASHASTINVPDPWLKNEEYYYWENGYYDPANIPVLEVEQTIGPNGQVNSYDSVRPISWYKILPSGGKSFYTALGHSAGDYVSDTNFINHVRDALLWLADLPNATPCTDAHALLVFQTPVHSSLDIKFETAGSGFARLWIYALSGQIIYEGQERLVTSGFTETIDITGLCDGIYLLRLRYGSKILIRKFVVTRN